MTYDVVYYDEVNRRWVSDGVKYETLADANEAADNLRATGYQARVNENKSGQEK